MTPRTLKKSAGFFVLLLVTLFFLARGSVFSAQPTASTPKLPMKNSVTAPVPLNPGTAVTGPSKSAPGQVASNNTPTSTPGGAPSSCPLTLSAGPKGDIRDIRGPIHIPNPTLWLFYGLAGVLLLLLAWALWKWFGKRRAFRARRAFEIAFEELEKAKAYMTPEKAERFSVMVSSTIRTYIEKRFNLLATRKTTREFISMVAAEPSGGLNQHRRPLQDFLVHCDLAKFARQSFSTPQMEKMLESAWRFVEETKPQPEKASEEDAASRTAAAPETAPKNIQGKTNFFKRSFLGRFSWGSQKETLDQGFNGARHVAAAGGR